MARAITASLKTESQKAAVTLVGLAKFVFDSGDLLLWTGLGEIDFAGDTYIGAGDLAKISEVTETVELRAEKVDFELSGIDNSVLTTALDENYQGRLVHLYIGFLAADGSLVEDPYEVFTGRLDTMEVELGRGASRITVRAEHRLVDLERPRELRWTDEDQRKLFPNDKGFQYVDQMVDKRFNWGQVG